MRICVSCKNDHNLYNKNTYTFVYTNINNKPIPKLILLTGFYILFSSFQSRTRLALDDVIPYGIRSRRALCCQCHLVVLCGIYLFLCKVGVGVVWFVTNKSIWHCCIIYRLLGSDVYWDCLCLFRYYVVWISILCILLFYLYNLYICISITLWVYALLVLVCADKI